jgi:hypothetical protein
LCTSMKVVRVFVRFSCQHTSIIYLKEFQIKDANNHTIVASNEYLCKKMRFECLYDLI